MAVTLLLRHLRATAQHDERLGFRRGLGSPFRGVGYLITHPRVLAMCLAPWLLNLFVVFPLTLLLLKFLLFDPIRGLVPDGNAWYWEAVRVIVTLGLIPSFVIGGLAISLVIGLVTGAPFHDRAGRMIERDRLRDHPDLISRDDSSRLENIRRSMKNAAKRLTFFLPRLMLLMLLGLIPVVGPVLALVANLAFTAAFLTLDAFSMPMDRRGIPFEAKVSWVLANRKFALGFGLPMLAVPCALFLMPPLAAVSGSLVYCDLLRDSREGSKVAVRN